MKGLKEYKKALLPLVSAAALMTLAGCYEERPYYGGQPPPPVAEGYAYYYYPDEEVYFYPATGVYFWSGGGGWHSGRHVPRDIELHNRVDVRLNTRVPYERHEEIRARYPRRGETRREERREDRHEDQMEHGGR